MLVAAARALIGVPFRWGGRDRRGGDCAGGIALAMEAAGLPGQVPPYGRTPDPDWLRRQVELLAEEIPVEDAGAGDVLLIRVGRQAQHLAIQTEQGRILHAYQAAGVVAEHPLDEHWRPRVAAAYRIRGL